ncbi:NAD(P)/FAD-dependent oxidoreductase [Patulibacter defluvii]|uniref:NAD(P)/FAD-dependent oxidoreductase n=1 Tax=Patulibacter defluvii TaxID=3095358 RepID=UPI002A749C8A|nr:NAD(P)/FAD-dependent oxidoreductase [Patulibacter sp. DM4]
MDASSIASEHDVVIVGGSLAGCTAATLLGRQGLRVALVERQPDPAAFKRLCSHFIQASAVPALERGGLLEPIERAGALRPRTRAWTRWGWIEPPPDSSLPAGVNLRRERLDPLLRTIAAETPGVTLLTGLTADRLVERDGAVAGVEARERGGRRYRLRAPLVIGADGRGSRTAELAGLLPQVRPHGRFVYGAYFEGPGPETAPDGTIWFLDPRWAAAFPTDDGTTLYAFMAPHRELPAFRRDPASALRAAIAGLPDAPPIAGARIVSPVLGKLDMPNLRRGPIAPGLALIGDAALAADPLMGVGCGWAFQSAEWLADAVAPALRGEQELAPALHRYRRRHRRGLLPHDALIRDQSSGRPLNAPERALFAAAAGDPRAARVFERVASRWSNPQRSLVAAVPTIAAGRIRRAAERARGRAAGRAGAIA